MTESLLRLADVTQRTGLQRSTIYRMIASGTFPRPRQVGARAVAWLASEIAAWIYALPVAGSKAGSPD